MTIPQGFDIPLLWVPRGHVARAGIFGVDVSVLVAQLNLGRRHSGPEEAIEKGEEYRGS